MFAHLNIKHFTHLICISLLQVGLIDSEEEVEENLQIVIICMHIESKRMECVTEKTSPGCKI